MKRMEESKTIYKGIMNVPLTIQSMRVLTPIMIKRLMQKNTELTERWRKQIKLSALFFDRAFESSRKKINGVEVNEDKDLTEDSKDGETINFDDSDKTVKENSKDDKTKTLRN
jgi:carboxyl-terminal processing protease